MPAIVSVPLQPLLNQAARLAIERHPNPDILHVKEILHEMFVATPGYSELGVFLQDLIIVSLAERVMNIIAHLRPYPDYLQFFERVTGQPFPLRQAVTPRPSPIELIAAGATPREPPNREDSDEEERVDEPEPEVPEPDEPSLDPLPARPL
ncbi:hypothetical protein C8Q76DRAFT_799176 [Earliella scabrosa]|nr:hypothetical protein C8Q76DRAFT_799176 [Earliella scabrosa]